MKCIAIDDEPIALQVIESHAAKVPFIQLVNIFTDAMEAVRYLQREPVDLIFLDINMPDISGIELYNSLRRKPLLIFTTAYPDYALTGFELDAVDYLLKPFGLSRFMQACNKAFERFQYGKEEEVQDFLFIKSGTEQFRVFYRDVLYLEANGNYVTFFLTENKKILSRMTMAEAEQLMPVNDFIRIHRSYIVSKRQIERADKNQLYVGGRELPVGEMFQAQVSKLF